MEFGSKTEPSGRLKNDTGLLDGKSRVLHKNVAESGQASMGDDGKHLPAEECHVFVPAPRKFRSGYVG